MIPVVGMFRGLFLGSVLVWYSSSVWKTMDNYYNQEFKKYLQKEKQARRIPTEGEVCSALPDAPLHAAGGAEALGANTAPGGGAASQDEGDATHTCAWRRRAEAAAAAAADSDSEDDGGTCPALF